MIEIIESCDGFDSLKEEWISIEASRHMRIQQTFLWNKEAWPSIVDNRKRLHIIKWQNENSHDTLIFPFYIDGNGTLRFINDLHNDHCDVVYSQSDANRSKAYREVVDHILNEKRIKDVWLQKLSSDSEALKYLGVFVPGAIVARDNSYAWIVVDETGDFATSQKHLKSEERKHLRYLLKKSSNCEFKILSQKAGNLFPESEIMTLRNAMVAKGVRSDGFLPREQLRFVCSLYEAGKCEIPMLLKDGEVVALNIHFIKDDTVLEWIFLGLEPHYGTEIDVRYSVEWAKKNRGIIDLGVGTYEYKLLTFRPFVDITYGLRMGKSYFRHMKQGLAMNVRFAKNYIKDMRQRRK